MWSGRPLLDNDADTRYFVDREQELAILNEAINRGLNAVVLGKRGSGRTSLLRQFVFRLRKRRLHPIQYIDGAVARDAIELLRVIAERVIGDDELYASLDRERRSTATGITSDAGYMLKLIDVLRTKLNRDLASSPGDSNGALWEPGNPLVVCLDSPSPEAGHALFGRLRDELWALPVLWIVGAVSETRATLLQPLADAFFDVRFSLHGLDEDAAVELLRRRTDEAIDEKTLRKIVGNGDFTPRTLVADGRDLLANRQSGHGGLSRRLRERSSAQSRVAALGRSEAMLVAELQARGGSASASDPELLDALGWTRPRVVQVLKRLAAEGWVSASDAIGPGGGRPKRVYELVEELR